MADVLVVAGAAADAPAADQVRPAAAVPVEAVARVRSPVVAAAAAAAVDAPAVADHPVRGEGGPRLDNDLPPASVHPIIGLRSTVVRPRGLDRRRRSDHTGRALGARPTSGPSTVRGGAIRQAGAIAAGRSA
ncbi:MAG TPA: hypothetical protein VFW13_04730 [Phenylobacterium sp.]|nr:hypothetical protein [Phenylobacterium sp.]